jgi:hypothetical protein
MVVRTAIDESRFAELAGALAGLPISRVWFGDYTALYLEIGPLTDIYSYSGRPKGQHTIYLGFDWVLESDAGQRVFSADNGSAKRIGGALTSDQVVAATLSASCELVLVLASHRRFRSVANAPGETEWTLYLAGDACIFFDGRSLVLESRAA